MNTSSQLSSLPHDFIRRLPKLVPVDCMNEAIEGLTQERMTTLRVNTLKASSHTLIPELTRMGISVLSVPWYADAFILQKPTLREFTDLPQYKEGLVYVQSLSSMLPPLILGPQPGQRILDLTAAPGSKTTQIAAMMQNHGMIVANDTSRTRLYRLEANLSQQGVINANIEHVDGRSLWKTYPEYFDAALVDAPCSMEGRFCTKVPHSFADWSLKKVRDLSLLQRFLLRSAISATKPGGTIVYSTCTLSPEENEGVLDWLMNKDKGVVAIEEIAVPGLSAHQGITAWGDRHYDMALERAIRIYPSKEMEGFFVVKLQKRKSMLPRVLDSKPRNTIFNKGPKKPEKRYTSRFQRGHKRIA